MKVPDFYQKEDNSKEALEQLLNFKESSERVIKYTHPIRAKVPLPFAPTHS